MKKIISLIAILTIAFLSCKKSSSSSAAGNLVGEWKISKVFIDTNKNNYRDINEMFIDTSFVTEYLKVKTDGTYTITYYSTVTPGTWAFVFNDTYLKITDPTSTPSTKYYFVENLTRDAMELKDTTGVASGEFTEWIFYVKL